MVKNDKILSTFSSHDVCKVLFIFNEIKKESSQRVHCVSSKYRSTVQKMRDR